jgi:xanthine/CO dehydrogenase XdhC/CoxF family maturation factor
MKELRRIFEVYEATDFENRRAAIATVVKLYGSSYRRPGARMLITDDGRWEGAISGGCLEGDALRKARQVMSGGKPVVVTYDTMDDDANSFGVGLGCNGIIDVLIEPIDPADAANPVEMLKKFIAQTDKAILATVFNASEAFQVQSGNQLLLLSDGTSHSNIADPSFKEMLLAEAEDFAKAARSGTKLYELSHGKAEVFFELLHPGINLVIFGGGYDSVPVVEIAKKLGIHVTVTNDCIANLTPKRFAKADHLVLSNRDEILKNIPLNSYTAAVLMSHNYKYDFAVFEQLLSADVNYIGMLGPRKRFQKMLDELAEKGRILSQQELHKIHSPVGLDIGAETPDEIALAIIAEIQAKFAGKWGGFLKEKPGFIHERPSAHAEKPELPYTAGTSCAN